jgi:hypothetical protein
LQGYFVNTSILLEQDDAELSPIAYPRLYFIDALILIY